MASDVVVEAQRQAEELIAEARREAAQLRLRAQTEAERLGQQARTESGALVARAEHEAAAVDERARQEFFWRRRQLQADADELRAEQDRINRQRTQLKQQLSSLSALAMQQATAAPAVEFMLDDDLVDQGRLLSRGLPAVHPDTCHGHDVTAAMGRGSGVARR